MTAFKIGFIGVGNMGEALVRGILKSGLLHSEQIIASDLDSTKLEKLHQELNINISKDNKLLVSFSDVIVIAVKPNNMGEVLSEISPVLQPPKWCISIAAGISTTYLESMLAEGVPVIRVMPNTPAMVGEGMSALCPGRYAKDEHIQRASDIFRSLGKVIVVHEKHMDAITALSGSGPAFIFLIIESLADAGVKLGLSYTEAMLLSAQTVLGSAKMVLETREHPAILKNRVTSPAGTTAEGLYQLEHNRLRATIMDAVLAAARRSKQLSSETKESDHAGDDLRN